MNMHLFMISKYEYNRMVANWHKNLNVQCFVNMQTLEVDNLHYLYSEYSDIWWIWILVFCLTTNVINPLRFNHIRPKILSTLTFRLPPEVFIRRMKSSFLRPVLGTVSSRCAKKTVVRMTELVAALLTVHGSLSFLADVDHLLDPSGRSVWFPVNHWCVRPVYHMVFL